MSTTTTDETPRFDDYELEEIANHHDALADRAASFGNDQEEARQRRWAQKIRDAVTAHGAAMEEQMGRVAILRGALHRRDRLEATTTTQDHPTTAEESAGA